MLIRSIISVIAILIMVVGNYIYFRDIFASKTKPHIFTWLIWAMIDAVACAAQVAGGAGVAASVIGANAVCGFVIFILAFRQGEKDITFFDCASLLGAIVAAVFLVVSENPLMSIILVVAIGVLGFIPTVRKSWRRPHEETFLYYLLMGIRASLTLCALDKFTLVTYLEPGSMVLANFGFAGFLFLLQRRRMYSDIM